MDKRTKQRLVHALQKYVFNPPLKGLLALGFPPTHAVLETVGRKSGKPRRTPVGNGLDRQGRTFWIVAEHGRRASYVRNLDANPRVRVKVRGRWRSGVAHVLADDEPHERLRTIGNRLNTPGVRALGTDLLTIRVDLDG